MTSTVSDEILLHAMPVPGGSERIPYAFTEAEKLWQRSETDFGQGNAIAAAAGFMSAAAKLRLPAGSAHDETAIEARCRAYENAALCWRSARAYALAKKTLERAAAEDTACAAAIRRAIAQLPGGGP